MAVESFSQAGEDLQIAQLLGRTEDVHYLDVGCLWPVVHSNSFLFYGHGGHGLCIDPNPEVADSYRSERPRDVFLNAAIGSTPGERTYYMFENPVFNTFSEERAALVQRRGKRRPGRALVDQVQVEIITLDEAIAQTGFAERCDGRLDFLSVDVEGMEAEVVGGFSFDALRPRLVVCEQIRRRRDAPPPEETEVAAVLAEHDYWIAGYTGHDIYFLDGR
jgi:FkbM family methyltransferase